MIWCTMVHPAFLTPGPRQTIALLPEEMAREALKGDLPWPFETFCYVAMMHSEDVQTVEETEMEGRLAVWPGFLDKKRK